MAKFDYRPSSMPMFTGTQKYKIVSGPSREDLFDALRLCNAEFLEEGERLEFCWIGRKGKRVTGKLFVDGILRCEHGLEYGADWTIHGYIRHNETPDTHYGVTLAYNTRTRQGFIWLP